MGDPKNRAKVSVALIGVGPTWDLHYHAAIQRLSTKICVRAVCDSVLSRAASVADEFQASPVDSPWLLTQRTDLHAWLILDPGWFSLYPAALAVENERPALFANSFSSSLEKTENLFQRSQQLGESLMPEFPQRFSPATTRLRELMATKLGRVRRIELVIPTAPGDSPLDWLMTNLSVMVGIFDWCAWLIGAPVSDISFHQSSSGPQLELSFQRRSPKPDTALATLRFSDTDGTITRIIDCERGSATSSGPTQICWQSGEAQGVETFSHERSPYEIILDQFCRRALGGLVPVPTYHDALQAIANTRRAIACMNPRRKNG